MGRFFLDTGADSVKLKLKRDRTRALKQGYPWIFADSLVELPRAPAGSRAMVRDRDGSLIAFGFYDPESPLAFRVVALERERLDDALIEKRLADAVALRRRLFDDTTTGFRLINGEGDALPGLVCDVYSNYAVFRLDGAGPRGFWNLAGVFEWLRAALSRDGLPLEGGYYKPRHDDPDAGQWFGHPLASSTVTFLENRAVFKADIVRGQKSGFFLDQRDNRARLGALSRDAKVLNVCGYTGGFSVAAGRGGAEHVTTVDIASPAIAAAAENWALNDLPSAKHEGVVADAFEFFVEAERAARKWDLIVVDPPSFASAERMVPQARESYQNLFAAALKRVNSGGIAALSSCSSHISPEMFFEICEVSVSRAKLRARVLGVYGQPEDHPFPLACRELQYLKFLMLRLEG
jgi:23S rRNA (cytosine1962-C5)-methyltransferase